MILGLPGESYEEQMQTAQKLKELQVQGVKIHLLVAMQNTALHEWYKQGRWQPLEFAEYTRLAADFIHQLHKDCIIHRFAGNGHPGYLAAPKWAYTHRKQSAEAIISRLKSLQPTLP